MVTWREAALALVCTVLVCGCEPPGGIITAAPPGTGLPRKPPDSEQPAEALCETTPKSNARASTPPASADVPKIALASPTAKGEANTTASGVRYETIKKVTGPEAKPG